MWEIAKSTSHKQGFMRRTISFVIVTLLAIIFVFLFNTQSVSAVDASWASANSITYNNNTYNGPASAVTNHNLGLDPYSKTYTYVEPAKEEIENETNTDIRKMHVIYFEAEDEIDNAINAKYLTYTYNGPTSFDSPSSIQTISISEKSDNISTGSTSCKLDVIPGLSWIVCPITYALSEGVDWLFDILTSFLTIKPLISDKDTGIFRAWSYMRNIANVAFVIVFLIVIYSQLTNFGVSNYGLKKLLPRLIIAAILVNLSYYICAIAIDTSNIVGVSIQDIFMNIRSNLVGGEGNNWSIGFSDYAAFILSGGTAMGVGIAAVVATLSTYTIGGIIFLLLPSLAAAFMAILVALVVMAARQAIVTILIIISPLAFVAYLLPNTEKWYEKWQSTAISMLILFPAFAVVFGGSQLAGAAIIQNADSLFTILMGMMIQVIPLFITPLLKNISDPILSKINDMATGYGRSATGKVREFSKPRAELSRARKLDIAAKKLKPIDTSSIGGKIRQYKPGMRLAQTMDYKRREREELMKNYETGASNSYIGTKKHKQLYRDAYSRENEKQYIEQTLDRDLQTMIRTTPDMLDREMKLRIRTDESNKAKANVDDVYKYLKANIDTDGNLGHLTQQTSDVARDISILAVRAKTAERLEAGILHDTLMNSPGGVNYAAIAGEHDDFGESRVRATAVAADAKTLSENASAAGILLEKDNLDDAGWLSVAHGTLPGPGNRRASIEQQIAAAQKIIQVGYEPNIAQLIEDVSNRLSTVRQGTITHPDEPEDIEKLQKALGAALAPSSKKPQYFPGPKLGELSRSAMTDSVRDLIVSTLTEEDLSMDSFGNMSLREIERINGVLTDQNNPIALAHTSREALAQKIRDTLASDIAKNKLTSKQVAELQAMVINLVGHP